MDLAIQKKLDNFFRQFKPQVYKKGEILIRADQDPSGVFYLIKGSVKEYAISKKGEELVINIFRPISFFPMSWAINQTANNYYYEAIEELEVRRAPREEIVNFIKSNSDVLFDLISRVYKGTDGILKRMVYLMSGEAYTRVITELLIASKRFGKTSPNDKTIKLKISEKDLASQAGMARETVSREIKLLKDKNLISFEKKIITVNNLDKLEKELS